MSLFHKVRLMDKQGNLSLYHWIRKTSITGITEVPVPGQVAGPQGDAINVMRAAVDVGANGQSLLTTSTVEELLTALDSVEKPKDIPTQEPDELTEG